MSIRETLISGQLAASIRKRCAIYEAWAEQFKQPNGWTVIPAEAVKAAPVTVTNEERGQLEQRDIWRDPPERLFCYIGPDTEGKAGRGSAGIVATVWTGLPLGYGGQGPEWRDNFGGRRRSVSVTIAGYTYTGTAFVSSGDYARLKRGKRHPY